jgi:FkbM family methyltransferase
MLRTLIKRWLLARGAILSRPPGQFDVTEYKLRRAKDRGLEIGSVLDGGAHIGDWTRMIKRVYPKASAIMVEPRADVQASLRQVVKELSGVVVAQTVLGATERLVVFHAASAQSSVLPDHRGEHFGEVNNLLLTPIDSLVKFHGWAAVDLMKLDLQGYELEALAGAAQILPTCQAVVLEVSFAAFQQGTPLALEVCAFMHAAGFTIYDILALKHRPLDGRMAQADVLFIRNNHHLFADNRWTATGSGFWTTMH